MAKRVRTVNRVATQGGDTGPGGSAEISIGPDYGERAGNDSTTHYVESDVSLGDLQFKGNLFSSADLDGLMEIQTPLTGSSSINFPEAEYKGSLTASSSFEDVTVRLPEIPTNLDTWVGDTVACADDNSNHDGEALSVEGTVATAKKALIGWELGGLSPNATLVSASVNLTVASVPVTDQDVTLFLVEDETWVETTVKCDDKPAEGASASSTTFTVPGTLSGGAAGDRHSFPIDTTAAFTRLASRMGTGRFSIYITGESIGGLLMTYESSETAPTQADSPTLTLEFTIPA